MTGARTSEVDPAAVVAGVAAARERIVAAAQRAGRDPADVRILAATKYVDAAACAAFVAAGVADLAESRLDALAAKRASGVVPEAARWHFIGRLQSRQAQEVAALVGAVHTLASVSAARRLATLAPRALPELLVQVNIDGDPAKDGFTPAEVGPFLETLPEPLVVRGFMAMPAWAPEPEASRGAFAALRELRDELAPRFAGRHRLAWLSIGTSQDFEVAVEEGATHVRLGRILYGHGEQG